MGETINISDLYTFFNLRLAQKLMDAEDKAILSGMPHRVIINEYFKWQIHGIGYNDHYSACMAYFSSHELNVLKHNGVYVYGHVAINRTKLFNFGIGIGVKLRKRLIYADQIGLIKLL